MAFDPNQPFEVVEGETQKPAFDPSQPFEAASENSAAPAAAQKPGFDPAQPFEAVEEHRPKFTAFEEFVAPVGQAFANLPKRSAQVLDFAKLMFQKPVDEIMGNHDATIEIADRMAKRAAELQEDRNVVLQASGEAGGVATDVASAAADLIPQLLLSGGIGALTGVAKTAVTMSAALSGLQSASGSFASNVAERTAQGESLAAAMDEEFLPSLASGAITGAVTKAFGAAGVESVFKTVGARGVSAKLFQVFKEAGSEASEEMIDEGGQYLNDLINNKKVTPEEAVKRVAYSGFLGLVLGGGVSGMHTAMTSYRPDIVEAEGAVSRARTVAPQTAAALQSVVDQNIAEAEDSLTQPMPPLPAAPPSPEAPTATQRIATAQANLKTATAAGDAAGIAAASKEINDIAAELVGGATAAREEANAMVVTDATVNGNREVTPETVIDPRDTEMAKKAAESLGLRYDGVQGDAAVNITDPATGNTLTVEPGVTVAELQRRVAAKAPPAAPAAAAPPTAVPPVIPAAPLPEAALPPSEAEVARANARSPEEKATQLAEGSAAVRAEVTKTGIVPTFVELQRATGDPAAAKALRAELQEQVTAAYPAETLPEGAVQNVPSAGKAGKAGLDKNSLTGDVLPTVTESGGRIRPMFTNDPNLTAQQIDTGVISTDKANRLYVPDEIMDGDQLNPAIDTAYDKEAGKFYVVSANTPYGVVAKPDDFSVPYRQAKSLQKAHQLVLAGTPDDVQNLHNFVNPDENTVGQALVENGFAPDAVPFQPEVDEVPAGAVATASGPTANTTQAHANVQSAINAGLVPPGGAPRPGVAAKLVEGVAKGTIAASAWQRSMAKHLLKSGIDLSKIEVEVVNQPNAKWSGLYSVNPTDVTRGKIIVNLGVAHEGGLMATAFHELFHHTALVKSDPNYKRNKTEQKAYENLTALWEHASREIYKINHGQYPTDVELQAFRADQSTITATDPTRTNRVYYGLTNLHEFISEALSNPKFMKALSQVAGFPGIKTSDKFKNILQAVRDAIKTLFTGTSVRNSAMNQAMDQALAFIQAGQTNQTRAADTRYALKGIEDSARRDPQVFTAPAVVVDGPGWVTPDGEFVAADDSTGIFVGGTEVMGGHEQAAVKYLQTTNPKVAAELQTKINQSIESEGVLNYGIVTEFMRGLGFVRVTGGGRGGTLYITGQPTRSQRQLLIDNAIEQKATLVHDFGGTRSRVLFQPDEAYSAARDRRSTTAMAGALETASPFVRTALKDTTYLAGNNADDLRTVQAFIDENVEAGAQLEELVDQLDLDEARRFPSLKLDDVQRGLARVQIARAADKMAAQLADNIANRRPVTDIYGRTVGIDGAGQQLLVKHYQDIAVAQNRLAQIELSKSGSYLSRVGALVAKMFSPAQARADYADPIKAIQQNTLRKDQGAQAIRTAFDQTRTTAADQATDKADKVLRLVTGLNQQAFDFFEEAFGKGSMQKSTQWLSRFTRGSGLPITTDISNAIAANMVKAVTPEKPGAPRPVLNLLQAEVQKQVAAQIEAALPKNAPAPAVHSAIQTFIKDTDHAALMEQAFNTAAAALRASPNLTAEQKATLEGVQFDLGQLKSAQEVVRQYMNLKDVVHKNLSSKEAARDEMIHDILVAAPHLSEAQTGAVVKALTSAFDAASRTQLQAELKRLTKTPAATKPAVSHFEDYLKLGNYGAYSDEALYNTIAANNPKLKLPSYDAVFLAKLEAEAQRIMRMPDDSDLRRTAVAKLNSEIAVKQVQNLTGKEKAWHYIGQLGPAIWQAGVLSGPPTQLVNVGSTAANVQKEAFFTALGYSVAAVKAGAPASQVGNFFADGVMGWFNQGKARAEFKRALTTGISKFRSERGEGASILESLSPYNPYALGKWVLRLATASDGFNATNANEMLQRMAIRYAMLQGGKNAAEIDAAITDAFNPAKEIYDQIEEQVAQEFSQGLVTTDTEKQSRINELLEKRRNDYLPGIVETQRGTAEEWTFNGQPKGIAGLVFDGAVGSMNRAFPPAKFFFSFMRTMANLLNTTLDFSPVGVARAYNFHLSGGLSKPSRFRYRDLERGSPEFYSKLGQGVAGTAAIFALAAMAMKGLEDEEDGKDPFLAVYGSGPTTAIERRQLTEGAGWQPNSIKIGPHRFSYLDWPVLNLALGAIGTLSDDVRYKRNADTPTGERAALLALGLMNVIMSKRLLQGASNLFTVIQNPDQRGLNAAKQIVSGVVGGFTNPQALKWARNTLGMGADGMVPVLDKQTTEGWLFSMVPASIGYHEAGLNVLGEEVKEFPWIATTKRFGVFDPVKRHPILTPLVAAGLQLPPPSKNVALGVGDQIVPMGRNPELWRAFVKYRGDALKKILTPERIKMLTDMEQSAAQDVLKGMVNETVNKSAKDSVFDDIKAGKLTIDFQKPDPKLKKPQAKGTTEETTP